MPYSIQIMFGMIPVIAVAVIWLLVQRKHYVKHIIGISAVVVITIIAGVSGFRSKPEEGTRDPVAREKMATAMALSGDLVKAQEVVQSVISEAYRDEAELLTARIRVLGGDFEGAELSYRALEKSGAEDLSEEMQMLNLLRTAEAKDTGGSEKGAARSTEAVQVVTAGDVHYAVPLSDRKTGGNGFLGLFDPPVDGAKSQADDSEEMNRFLKGGKSSATKIRNHLTRHILGKMKESLGEEEAQFRNAANTLHEIENSYRDFLKRKDLKTVRPEETAKWKAGLDEAAKTGALPSTGKEYQRLQTMLSMMSGDLSNIGTQEGNVSTRQGRQVKADNLLMTANLYATGQLKDEDLKKREPVYRGYAELAEKVKRTYPRHKDGLEEAEKRQLEEIIAVCDDRKSSQARRELKTALLIAGHDRSVSNASKLNLVKAQMEWQDATAKAGGGKSETAKTDRTQEERRAASDYRRALDTSMGNPDPSYRFAAQSLRRMVDRQTSAETMKQVPSLVQGMVSRIGPFPMRTDFNNPQQLPGGQPPVTGGTGFLGNFDFRPPTEEKKKDDPEKAWGDEKKEVKTPQERFIEYLGDETVHMRNGLSITQVDASEFPKVRVRFNLSSDLELDDEGLKEQLVVTDTGEAVTDFSLEKVNITQSYLGLCCDVSGSMEGQPIEDLKAALRNFIREKDENMKLNLVLFNSSIISKTGYTDNKGKLTGSVESIEAKGGTDMYGALLSMLKGAKKDPEGSSYIFLLSDGKDNNPCSAEQMRREIGSLSRSKGITVYTMGLGPNVDSGYLQQLASAGGGTYLQLNASSTMKNFYNRMKEQVLNEYEVTYEVTNTLQKYSRVAKLMLRDFEGTTDRELYTVGTEVIDEDDWSTFDEESALNEDYVIEGLDRIQIERSETGTPVHLVGEGFRKDENAELIFKGPVTYGPFRGTYKDSHHYAFRLPGDMEAGEYKVFVTIRKPGAEPEIRMRIVLKRPLTVVEEGAGKLLSFGGYTFTAENISEEPGAFVLSGNVLMNGWLSLGDMIRLEGDIEDGKFTTQEIEMHTAERGYILFDKAKARGTAKQFVEAGIRPPVVIPQRIRLYDDNTNDGDKYTAQAAYYGNRDDEKVFSLFKLIELEGTTAVLKPQSLDINIFRVGKIPEALRKAEPQLECGFELKDCMLRLNSKEIGFRVDTTVKFNLNKGDGKTKHQQTFFRFLPNVAFSLLLDTVEGEYSIGGEVDIRELKALLGKESPTTEKESQGLGLTLYYKPKDKFRGELKADIPVTIPTNIGTFTMKNFNLKAERSLKPDKSEDKKNLPALLEKEVKTVRESTYSGGMDLRYFSAEKMGSVLEKVPLLKRIKGINEFYLLAGEGLSLEWKSAQNGYLKFSGKLKALGFVELGSAEGTFGSFKLENTMLRLPDRELKGIDIQTRGGVGITHNALKVISQNRTRMVVTGNENLLSMGGEFELENNVLFRIKKKMSGHVEIAARVLKLSGPCLEVHIGEIKNGHRRRMWGYRISMSTGITEL